MSEPHTDAEEPWIAAVHALPLAETVARWGVTLDELFAGLAVDAAVASDPRRRLPISVFAALVARAKALTGEPGLGFYVGLQMRVSSYGYLGFAAMASATLRGALELAVRFAPTRSDALSLRLHEGDGHAALVLEEHADLGAARDVLVISLITGLHELGAAVTGKHIEDSADIAFAAPDYASRFAHLTRDRLRFGQPMHQLVFPSAALDLPLVQADPVAVRLAIEQCEHELGALGFERKITARVRAALPRAGEGFRSIEETAAALGLSTRTLKRRLADEGTSFTALVDEQRRDRALLLLRSPDTSIEAVAAGVGYSDVANFTRAFRRWTGATPGSYRRGRGA